MAEYIKKADLVSEITWREDRLAAESPVTRANKRAKDRAIGVCCGILNYVRLMPPADVVGAYDEVSGPVDRRMLMELLEKDYQRIKEYWRDASYTREKYLEGYRAAMDAVESFTEKSDAARKEQQHDNQ